MPLLPISFSRIYYERFRTTKIHTVRRILPAIGIFYQIPSVFYRPVPWSLELTSCSWFSNILHQKPIGGKNLMRDRGHENIIVSTFLLSLCTRAKPWKFLIKPLGKPSNIFCSCLKFKRKQKIPHTFSLCQAKSPRGFASLVRPKPEPLTRPPPATARLNLCSVCLRQPKPAQL